MRRIIVMSFLLLVLVVKAWGQPLPPDEPAPIAAAHRQKLEKRDPELWQKVARQYQAQNLPEAEQGFRQAVDLLRQAYPGGHPGLAASMNNLALVIREQGQPSAAEPLLREALGMFNRLYPPDQYPGGHPHLATSLNNLAAGRQLAALAAGASPRRAIMAKHPAVDALQKASKGLSMPSESDAPFEAFLWDTAADMLSQDKVVKLAGAVEGSSVEEDTLDGLFRTVPNEDKAKFQKLAEAIKQQLSGVKVYKVGDEAEREVYIVGRTMDGKWAGLKTSVVET
jgi:hypothetical protein